MLIITSGYSVTAIALNNPPNAPQISGPNSGKPNTLYEFTFIATDSDGDNIYYNVSWNCCIIEWHIYGPFPSGQIVKLKNSWPEQGAHTITAKAIDVYGAEGPEGTFNINIQKNKSLDSYFFQILPLRFQKIIQTLQFIFFNYSIFFSFSK